MIIDDSRLEKLRQEATKIARKQSLLEAELSQCPNYPQPGDIFVFAHPKTMGLQWVILSAAEPQRLLIVPADDVAMVGSTDIDLPAPALCSPLTLRCRQSLWIRATDFDMNLRVGLLETWHRLRALEKVKQIAEGKLISSVSQQQMDDEHDYKEWMAQVNEGRHVLEQSLKPIIPAESSWRKMVAWLKETLVSWQPKEPVFTWQVGWAIPVVLALIVGFVVVTKFNLPENQIDISYQMVMVNKTIEVEENLHEHKFPWEKPALNVYGFSAAKPPSLAVKAFGAGLLTGKRFLLGKKSENDWLTTEAGKDYFELGRWTILLWAVSQPHHDMDKPFWDKQRQILAKFKGAFETRQAMDNDAKIVLIKLDKLEPVLEKLPDEKALYKLQTRLETMMEHLAPSTF